MTRAEIEKTRAEIEENLAKTTRHLQEASRMLDRMTTQRRTDMSSLLTDLVRKQTATSAVAFMSRAIDTLAEELARDLLRDPEFRAEMQQLVRAAFRQTLKELNDPAPAPAKP